MKVYKNKISSKPSNNIKIITVPDEIYMQFVFDENKLLNNNLSVPRAMEPLRIYFKNHNITESETGLFKGTSRDWEAFASCFCSLIDAEWFMTYIKKWIWYVDGRREDCLKELEICKKIY